MSHSLFALHGFLGLPSDWQHFDNLSRYCDPLRAIDLFHSQYSVNSLEEWAQSFIQTLPQSPQVIMGYSLGARLAMHTVLAQPTLWRAAIFISGSPGLIQEEEKSKRLIVDKAWAQQFKDMTWDALIEKWNNLDVFGGIPSPFERLEKDFSRNRLALTLDNWSIGKQKDLRQELQALDLPILWIVGQNDAKYKALAQNLTFKNPFSKVVEIPNAFHRAPWENPVAFEKTIINFLENIPKG